MTRKSRGSKSSIQSVAGLNKKSEAILYLKEGKTHQKESQETTEIIGKNPQWTELCNTIIKAMEVFGSKCTRV